MHAVSPPRFSCFRGELYIPYSALILRVFNFTNFANLERFAKLFQRNFYTSAMHRNSRVHAHRHIIHVLSMLSVFQERGWPVSHVSGFKLPERSPNKCPRPRTSAISLREGQGSIPEKEREEGRNWKASGRAWSASYHSLLKLGHAPPINSFTWVWRTNSRNYLNETFKNDYLRLFRPTKF